jgi:hypothetical protein
MRGKHIIFGRDSEVREEEVEDWEATFGPFPPPTQTIEHPSEVARKVVELIRAATSLDDLKRALLLHLGELKLRPDGRLEME